MINKNVILGDILVALTNQAAQCLDSELEPGEKMQYNTLSVDTIKKVIESMKDIDYKDINLTQEEKDNGWKLAYCPGNGYKAACKKPYRTLNWFTPSGCPHCSATFVD